jgi:hypothetical protein
MKEVTEEKVKERDEEEKNKVEAESAVDSGGGENRSKLIVQATNHSR